MAKKRRAITQSLIAKLKPGDDVGDTVEPGLRVVKTKTGTTFYYRYRDKASRSTSNPRGKLKQAPVGDAEVMPIGDGRQIVRDLKKVRAGGQDPARLVRGVREEAVEAALEETAQASYTFKELLDDFAREKLGKTKRGAERERTLRYDLEQWYRREADGGVTRKDVKALLESIGTRAPKMPGRVLRDLRAAYQHAIDLERIREGSDPTAGVKAPEESRYQPRDRAFVEGEWRKWFAWLPISGMSGDVQDALRLIAYTAARPGEVTAMLTADVDLDAGTWIIRARKRAPSHLVYLSPPAIALLSRRNRDGDFVFPSPTRRGRPMREHALVWSITNARDSCPLARWTAHDLRRSVATLLGEMNYTRDLIERVLGHYSIKKPADIYIRSTRDAEAKRAWLQLGERLSQYDRPRPVGARRRVAS